MHISHFVKKEECLNQRSANKFTYIWHIWHVLLYRAQHWHIILLSVWILLMDVVLHKISAGSSTKLHFTTYLVMSPWGTGHSTSNLASTILWIIFPPVFMMQNCIRRHGRVHLGVTLKLRTLHIKSHSNVVLWSCMLVISLLVLGAKLLSYIDASISIIRTHSPNWTLIHGLILS